MSEQNPTVNKSYFYCSTNEGSQYRGRQTLYLVHSLTGSKVVAYIQPIEMVHTEYVKEDAQIAAVKNGFVLAGGWSDTKRKKHRRIKAIIKRGSNA